MLMGDVSPAVDRGLSKLYELNTPARLWRSWPDVSDDAWLEAAEAAAGLLPNGSAVLARGGWAGLMEHILGEGQFGPDRFRLSRAKQLYYLLKPFLPRWTTAVARRRYRRAQRAGFRLGWPVEDRYVRFLHQMLAHTSTTADGPDRARSITWEPAAGGRHSGIWPNDAHFAFVLTHDVEAAAGQAFVRRLADLDERYGFRSSFNFVPEEYPIDQSLLDELRGRGFEVGVHGLKHDGKLLSSRAAFEHQAGRINEYLRAWGAVGFRSPLTHRDPEAMQLLEIDYDSSFFDTDPFEPMAGGTMSIWPFFCGRFVELPYTLAQDYTLLVVLGQRTPALWLDKVDFIAHWGGMALLNVHPDYMRDPRHLAVYEQFLQQMAERANGRRGSEEAEPAGATTAFWHALPRDVAHWWRTRADAAVPETPCSSASGSPAGGSGRAAMNGRVAHGDRPRSGATIV
jgi:hypothetical protein